MPRSKVRSINSIRSKAILLFFYTCARLSGREHYHQQHVKRRGGFHRVWYPGRRMAVGYFAPDDGLGTGEYPLCTLRKVPYRIIFAYEATFSKLLYDGIHRPAVASIPGLVMSLKPSSSMTGIRSGYCVHSVSPPNITRYYFLLNAIPDMVEHRRFELLTSTMRM